MKNMKLVGLFILVQLLAVMSVMGQNRVVLSAKDNAVAFTNGNKTDNAELWGLEVDGKEVFSPQYKSVAYQEGLYKLQNVKGLWNVSDKAGNLKLGDWTKASDVKVTAQVVLFENADGNKAIIYDRNTWKVTQATQISHNDMYAAVMAANAHKGTTIPGYETSAERSRRYYSTYPRIVRKGREISIKIDEEVIASWVGAASWIARNEMWGQYPDGDKNRFYLWWSDDNVGEGISWFKTKNEKIIGGSEVYVKVTPNPLHKTQLFDCQTPDGIVHPIWIWGTPLLNSIIPNESWGKDEDAVNQRKEMAKKHGQCAHCLKLAGE